MIVIPSVLWALFFSFWNERMASLKTCKRGVSNLFVPFKPYDLNYLLEVFPWHVKDGKFTWCLHINVWTQPFTPFSLSSKSLNSLNNLAIWIFWAIWSYWEILYIEFASNRIITAWHKLIGLCWSYSHWDCSLNI